MWDDFANWYVEFAKIALKDDAQNKMTQAVLLHVLKAVLKLLHPFIPFVTEKLYAEISDEPSLMISKWPVAGHIDLNAMSSFNEIQEVITNVRNLRSAYQVIPSKPLDIQITIKDKALLELFKTYEPYLVKFLNAQSLSLSNQPSTDEEQILRVTKSTEIYIKKADLIDQEKELADLKKNKEKLIEEIKRSESLLNNPNFISKAPEAKLSLEKEKYETYLNQLDLIEKKLKNAL
jgi:valyl-tRNA synthetase